MWIECLNAILTDYSTGASSARVVSYLDLYQPVSSYYYFLYTLFRTLISMEELGLWR